ncbi:MAG TPA: glycoside hydrolase family 3 N-terminal domain-containing protein, partial [Ktedonobacterales bacterium]|nr:glycoside hydrolase family 3 N-terminal domain-containing protein [Ktedonobacterales bacterium]
VGAVGALAGVVLVASLLGRVFLVNAQTGALTSTPIGQLGITPPASPVRHNEPQDLRDLNQAIDTYISKMSLDDELGQMMQVQFVGPGESTMTSIPSYWLSELQKVHVGSAILYWYNIKGVQQVKALTASLQSKSFAPNIPMMITTDEEGGDIMNYVGCLYGNCGPTESSLGASNDPKKAYNWGKQAGQDLKSLGFNADLAPVVDVQTVPNTYEGDRIYSSSPTVVSNMAAAFIDGLHSVGIPNTLKHWPGYGWASANAHDVLPVSNRSLADFERIDFAPYKALIASGRVDMIMPTHMLLTQIDPKMPTSLSPKIIDGILRQQLGFQGVVITDAIYMGALGRYSMAERAVLAVIAGDDIISNFYDPNDLEAAMAALHQAIKSGQITRARIDQSVKRILTLKVKYGIWTPPGYNG